MAHYRVRYAAHQRSSHSPQSPTAFLEKGEPLRERSPQHSVSTKGLGPCASQPGGPFSSRTAVVNCERPATRLPSSRGAALLSNSSSSGYAKNGATSEQSISHILQFDLGRGFCFAGGFDGFLAKPGLDLARRGR